MYSRSGLLGGGTAIGSSGLAYTGLNTTWLLLGAFALLGAGLALLRLIPRREG